MEQFVGQLQAFSAAVREARFSDARSIMSDLRADSAFWPPLGVSLESDILAGEGQFNRVVKLLLDIMASGKHVIEGCHFRLANMYFENRMLVDAERTYLSLLDSRIPHAVTYYHSTAAYRIAWILADRGDARYASYLAKCPNIEGDYLMFSR